MTRERDFKRDENLFRLLIAKLTSTILLDHRSPYSAAVIKSGDAACESVVDYVVPKIYAGLFPDDAITATLPPGDATITEIRMATRKFVWQIRTGKARLMPSTPETRRLLPQW